MSESGKPFDIARERLVSAERLVVFSGAGLSAESGIATFRDGAGTGLWSRYDPAQLASVAGFERDPELVLRWYGERRRALAAASPNAAHHALAAATHDRETSGRSLWQITQNVDDLLERAGVPDKAVDHLHGRLDRDRCHARCGEAPEIDLADPPEGGLCTRCGAPLRPDVVWFGETLPEDTWRRATARLDQADALLVVGTSAVVWPAAGLVENALRRGLPTVIVDPDAESAIDDQRIALCGAAGTLLPALLGVA